jgi:hypothetical protein
MGRYSEQIKKLEIELADLKEKDLEFSKLPRDHQLAICLHDSTCRWNHTDGCSWGYEIDPNYPGGTWNGPEHSRYLDKAHKLIQKFPNLTNEDIIGVITAANAT